MWAATSGFSFPLKSSIKGAHAEVSFSFFLDQFGRCLVVCRKWFRWRNQSVSFHFVSPFSNKILGLDFDVRFLRVLCLVYVYVDGRKGEFWGRKKKGCVAYAPKIQRSLIRCDCNFQKKRRKNFFSSGTKAIERKEKFPITLSRLWSLM